MAFQSADQIGRNEAQDTAFRFFDDEMPEAGDGHATWAALVHHGGDAGAHTHHVCIETEAPGDVLIDMGMRIDHACDDDLPSNIDHLARGIRGKRGLDRCNATAADADIGNAVSV